MHEIDLSTEQLDGLSPLDMFGHDLSKTITQIISERSEIEERWVEDIRQYKGRYDEQTMKMLQDTERSSVFVNITRPKADAGESQMADMLFPSDDKNWGINSTPSPDLMEQAKNQQPVQTPDGGHLEFADDGSKVTQGDMAKLKIEQAEAAARLMEREIEDQLIECDYNSEARRAIHYAAVLGTGILCGPEVEVRTYKNWAAQEGGEYGMEMRADHRPRAYNVLPWDFFPDLAATTVDECEHIFVRSYMTRKQVRSLAKRRGFLKENVQALLKMSPKETQSHSDHVNTLREMSGLSSTIDDNRYEIWKYHGPISTEILVEAGIEIDAEDPLQEVDGIVVFAGTKILRVALNPLDSEDWPYSVFCWARDDSSIFGYGVPYLTRNSQRIVNTSWRMMLDNAGKSAGPQIVFRDGKVVPVDNDHVIRPWKQWRVTDKNASIHEVFGTFNFDNHQQQLSEIFQMAKAFMDEESGLPMVSQGEMSQIAPTLGAQSMLMNAANTVRRRQIKDWDDRITKPMLRRFYDWNMQFNKKPEIKGDFEVEARGTSALLIKETQSQNLLALLDRYTDHPYFKGPAGMRKAVQALNLEPDELVKTDEEIQAEQAAMQEQQQQDPAMAVAEFEAQADQQLEQLRAQNRMQELEREAALKERLAGYDLQKSQMSFQTQMMKLAQDKEVSLEKIAADLQKASWGLDLDKSKFLTEVEIKRQMPPTGNYGLE